MMRTYIAPEVVEYGSISVITRDFGVNGAPDDFVTPNGATIAGRTGSDDGCAQEPAPGGGIKCQCTDNGSC